MRNTSSQHPFSPACMCFQGTVVHEQDFLAFSRLQNCSVLCCSARVPFILIVIQFFVSRADIIDTLDNTASPFWECRLVAPLLAKHALFVQCYSCMDGSTKLVCNAQSHVCACFGFEAPLGFIVTRQCPWKCCRRQGTVSGAGRERAENQRWKNVARGKER